MLCYQGVEGMGMDSLGASRSIGRLFLVIHTCPAVVLRKIPGPEQLHMTFWIHVDILCNTYKTFDSIICVSESESTGLGISRDY